MRLHLISTVTLALIVGCPMQARAAAPTQSTKTPAAAVSKATPTATSPEKKMVSAFRLMTPEERQAFHEKMRSFKTPQERHAYRIEHHKLMEKRAAERGETLRALPTQDQMRARAAQRKAQSAAAQKQPAAPAKKPAIPAAIKAEHD